MSTDYVLHTQLTTNLEILFRPIPGNKHVKNRIISHDLAVQFLRWIKNIPERHGDNLRYVDTSPLWRRSWLER